MIKKIDVGVLGATGMVGQQFVNQLAAHPWFDLAWLAASERSEGRCYLDALAGIAVSGLGHGHPALSKAIAEQAAKLIHTSTLFEVREQERLADKVCAIAGMDNAFFCNSGAEANECAIKIARLYGHHRVLFRWLLGPWALQHLNRAYLAFCIGRFMELAGLIRWQRRRWYWRSFQWLACLCWQVFRCGWKSGMAWPGLILRRRF